MTDQELIKLYQDQQDALGDGCGDGNCVIKKPVGMHTNGGCRCLYNLDFTGRQRVGVMLQVSQKMAGRIEDVVKERDDYKDLYYAAFKDAASLNIHYAEIGYKAKTAEAKLAKAVEWFKKLDRRGDALETFDPIVHEIVTAALAELGVGE